MSRTLVIHPSDKSTDFLKYIYNDKDYDVITDCFISSNELKAAIEAHDRIIMLGHGTARGLLNPNPEAVRHTLNSYLIDSTFADLLSSKETVSIWCYSYNFFNAYCKPHSRSEDKSLHTGMIISEVLEELIMLGEVPLDAQEILDNMIYFSKIVGKCIEKSGPEMKAYILKYYQGDDRVTQFNRKNILVY